MPDRAACHLDETAQVPDALARMETRRQFLVERIVSGGQTGVDRGALEAAIALGIAHGGWCPRGRLAEDGRIPERYLLTECESPQYRERTERNVLDSDGTLILFRKSLRGGTELTRRLAVQYSKPQLTVNLDEPCSALAIRQWLIDEAIKVLNVAGPRESSSPGIADESSDLLKSVLRPEGEA